MNHLVIGLGNIGEEYLNTRHNVGFMVLDKIASDKGLKFLGDNFCKKIAINYRSHTIHLIKPSTYMNCSGRCVKHWKDKLRVGNERILIVVDDIALPLSKIRLKPQGSHAGHNGLLDIESELGSNIYPRLRIGIGDNFQKGQQANYVLSKFEPLELEILETTIIQASQAIMSFVIDGIDVAMNRYNKSPLASPLIEGNKKGD